MKTPESPCFILQQITIISNDKLRIIVICQLSRFCNIAFEKMWKETKEQDALIVEEMLGKRILKP